MGDIEYLDKNAGQENVKAHAIDILTTSFLNRIQ